MLSSILTQFSETGAITLPALLLCTVASIALGLAAAFVYMYKNTYSKGFALTLAILPAVVQLVIMLVNGNLGTGVAVAGAFSLVRFRSAAGSAREILAIFLAMALGLATGMGYVGIAGLFLVPVGGAILLLTRLRFGEDRSGRRRLKVLIPENLDYTGAFDDVFDAYCASASLESVKTTNLGSMFELHYLVTLKNGGDEKRFLDEIRCRNGNLNITCAHSAAEKEAL